MESEPIKGILIDLDEVKESTKLVLWGRLIQGNGDLYPHMKLLEIPIGRSLELIKTGPPACDTYFTFE